MQVQLTVDNAKDSLPVLGKVHWVNPVANSMSRTFGVRIIIPNPQLKASSRRFRRGAHSDGEEGHHPLSVPRSAIVDSRVFVLRDRRGARAKGHGLLILTEKVLPKLHPTLNERDLVVVKGANKALPDSAEVNVKKPKVESYQRKKQ